MGKLDLPGVLDIMVEEFNGTNILQDPNFAKDKGFMFNCRVMDDDLCYAFLSDNEDRTYTLIVYVGPKDEAILSMMEKAHWK